MTTEQKLQAIIEAQVRGGYDTFGPFIGWELIGNEFYGHSWGSRFHILEILLDPNGLRAMLQLPPMNTWEQNHLDEYTMVGEMILSSWLHSDGDAAKTIDKAYGLLPTTNVSTPPTENEER